MLPFDIQHLYWPDCSEILCQLRGVADNDDCRMVAQDVFPRRLLNLLGGNRFDARAISLKIVSPEVEHVGLHNPFCNASLCRERERKETVQIVLCALQFARSHLYCAQAMELPTHLSYGASCNLGSSLCTTKEASRLSKRANRTINIVSVALPFSDVQKQPRASPR